MIEVTLAQERGVDKSGNLTIDSIGKAGTLTPPTGTIDMISGLITIGDRKAIPEMIPSPKKKATARLNYVLSSKE